MNLTMQNQSRPSLRQIAPRQKELGLSFSYKMSSKRAVGGDQVIQAQYE